MRPRGRCLLTTLVMLLAAIFWLPGNAGRVHAEGETPAQRFAALREKLQTAQDGEEILLEDGDYLFTETLVLEGKSVVLKAAGSAVFKRGEGFSDTFLTVAEGAGLTLESGIEIDGEQKESRSNANLLSVKGTLTINGGRYHDAKGRGGSYRAPIIASGKNARITLNQGTIENHDYSTASTAYSSGAFRLENGAEMVMNGGIIRKNQASVYYPYPSLLWSDSPGAGAVFVAPGSKMTMNGGEISENQGWAGAVLVGSASPYDYERSAVSEDRLKPQELATAVFSGGILKGNRGVGGGGISANGNVEVSLPEGSTVVIRENRAYQGGGVFVSDWAVDGIGLEKEIAKLPIDIWEKHYAGKFHMAGGQITENRSDQVGGGVLISSNGGLLTGGEISNNVSGDYGGGVGVTTIPYTLKIENAYVSGNQATGSKGIVTETGIYLPAKSGGGAWFCPTGEAKFYAENGATIVDNHAGEAGDELWSSDKLSGNYSVTLTDRLIGGTKIRHYEDKKGARYQEPGVEVQVKDASREIAVKSIADSEGVAVAKALSKLMITGNTSSKGGGIGSNGNVVFGKVPKEENPLKEIEIIKIWEKGLQPKEIKVELRAKEGETDWLIETCTLNTENGFRCKVKDLPATVHGKPIEELLYVKELQSEEYQVTVGKIERQEGAPTLSFRLNRPQFSDYENLMAVYQENAEVFDQEAWELKNFEVAIRLEIAGQKEPVIQKMTYNKESYSWEGNVAFEGIPITGKDVKVEYEEAPKGGFVNPGLLEYRLTLKKNDQGEWVLKIPRLRPSNVQNPTGEETVLRVEELAVKAPEQERFSIQITNKERIPVTPLEPAKRKLQVTKEWKGIQPEKAPEIKVYLVKNGKKTDRFLTLNRENEWKGTFEDLPVTDTVEAEENVYTVVEEGEKDGRVTLQGDTYKVTYDKSSILNEKIPPEVPKKPEQPGKIKKNEKQAPKTGDTRTLPLLLLTMVSAAGILTSRKRSGRDSETL